VPLGREDREEAGDDGRPRAKLVQALLIQAKGAKSVRDGLDDLISTINSPTHLDRGKNIANLNHGLEPNFDGLVEGLRQPSLLDDSQTRRLVMHERRHDVDG
jgi:hypothetical protein